MDADECRQEQEDEHEALESMFMEDEFKIITAVGEKDPWYVPFFMFFSLNVIPTLLRRRKHSVELHLVPFPDESEENHVAIKLRVLYPKMYPEVVPSLEIESEKGLNKTQIEELSDVLKENAEENLGMPMVFTLAEAAKEWMQERNVESKGDGSAFERMQQRKQEIERAKLKEAQKQEEKERRQNEAEAEIKKKTRQLLVCITKEEFFEWRDAFEKERRNNQTTVKRNEQALWATNFSNGSSRRCPSVREVEKKLRSKRRMKTKLG